MIVITGGSGRLGSALVELFKEDGKVVVNVSRSKNNQADYNLLHDLSDSTSAVKAAEEIKQISEQLEVVINAAGIFVANPFGKITSEEIRQSMAINAELPIVLASSLMECIKKDGTDIVNVASKASINTPADIPVYTASKWALRGFSGCIREALKDYPSRVITVYPGSFDSDIITKSPANGGLQPAEDLMSADEVAKFIKQLLDQPRNMEVTEVILDRKGYND